MNLLNQCMLFYTQYQSTMHVVHTHHLSPYLHMVPAHAVHLVGHTGTDAPTAAGKERCGATA